MGYVLKFDGAASGKGVLVTESAEEAVAAIQAWAGEGPDSKPHEHELGRCAQCYSAGRLAGEADGYERGQKDGYDEATEDGERSWSSGQTEASEEFAIQAKEAHRRAGHGGRWEDCGDVVCSALERFVYERAKTTAANVGNDVLGRMVSG